ncbi:hypothetical protein Tco_0823550 [Tanacetum coccineum]|uniref:Uncharacterized protein n=1 Tax=Tanacetum coccineum TaxID=301880 RepID=A0ABQ5AJ75_9ASTR
MMVQAQEEMGEGSAIPTDPHHTLIITQPSSSQPQRKQKLRRPKEKDTQVPQSSVPSDPTNVADEAVTEEPKASLGDQEDASKQERKIDDIDAAEDITLENVHDAKMFDVNDLDVIEVVVDSGSSKDKGKAKMIEPEKPLKRKDRIKFDEEDLRLQEKFDEEDRLAREKAQQVEEATLLE